MMRVPFVDHKVAKLYIFFFLGVSVGTESKYKFLSEQEGDKEQLERLYKACRGFSQVKSVHSFFSSQKVNW
jgi:hypothetical protein